MENLFEIAYTTAFFMVKKLPVYMSFNIYFYQMSFIILKNRYYI